MNIRALPAELIVKGADDHSIFEPANLLVRSLVDADGARLFQDHEKSETMVIDHMSLRTLLDAIMEMNGLKSAGPGEVGDVEKN